jgi:hypothetical protein
MTFRSSATGASLPEADSPHDTTGIPLRYGDSSNEEMCFTGVCKYPAGGILFSCPI